MLDIYNNLHIGYMWKIFITLFVSNISKISEEEYIYNYIISLHTQLNLNCCVVERKAITIYRTVTSINEAVN